VAALLDTNVLVYAFDRGDERKRRVALDILAADELPIVVSAQVLNEFYWTVTRKLRPAVPTEVAQEVVRNFAAGRVVAIDADLVMDAIATSRAHDLSLWDAGIVCAAKRAGCPELLTEDLSHGEVIGGVTIRNPFLQE